MSDNAVWHLKVIWHHDFTDEPVEILSEIGSDRYEVRKVEIYRDGRLDWAGESRRSPNIGLGEIPFPEQPQRPPASAVAPDGRWAGRNARRCPIWEELRIRRYVPHEQPPTEPESTGVIPR